jgi:DNA-binding response OmpR family regulator
MNATPLPRILIIEDEPDLREATLSYLATEQMHVHGVESLRQANEWSRTHGFDILVLDLGLPDGDGLIWLQQTLAVQGKGVIIMTARGQTDQRLLGLRAGADSYLVKPVPMEELALHIKKLFSRILASQADAGLPPTSVPSALEPGWQLNAKTWHLIAPNGKQLLLRHAEKTLLQALLSQAGEVLSKDKIIQSQTANPDSYDYRRIETLIRRLRERCRQTLGAHLPIQTIYGKGLAFTEHGKVSP